MRLLHCGFCTLVLAATAGVFAPAIAHADIIGFGNFSNFTINQADGSSAPSVSPGSIHLTYSSGGSEDRSIFCDTPQNVSQFTASFTYESANAASTEYAGVCFVLQNASAGLHAIGGNTGGSFGYGYGNPNMSNSAAIALELGPVFNQGKSMTGLYTNGTVNAGSQPISPVNLYSGDPIDVTLSYDGSSLQETLLDTVTSASFTTGYLTNLPSLVGGSTALVGFTASTDGGYSTPDQFLSNFQFTTSAVPEPSTFALLSVGTIGLLGYFWKWRRTASRIQPNQSTNQSSHLLFCGWLVSCGNNGCRREHPILQCGSSVSRQVRDRGPTIESIKAAKSEPHADLKAWMSKRTQCSCGDSATIQTERE